ncbi:hypothetical protein BDV10DRAFT_173055 [Aspergillus recurvatus]
MADLHQPVKPALMILVLPNNPLPLSIPGLGARALHASAELSLVDVRSEARSAVGF